MSIRKLSDGNKKPWLCECYPQGRSGVRKRKRFATKGEALAYEKFLMKEVDDKPWLGDKKDLRTLQDLVELWYKLHGQHLTSASKVYPRLCTIVEELGNPFAIKFTAKEFVHWRSSRKAKNRYGDETTAGKSISAPTNNLDLRYLRAVFNELIALGEWTQPNPLTNVKSIQVTESEMGFFSNEEITMLFDRISKSKRAKEYELVCKICLSTGARISEANNLRLPQITKHKITFLDTKSKKNRTVPITEKLYNELIEFERTGEKDKLFKSCLHGIAYIVNKTFPDLPEGQNTHVFRHTFASRFMEAGGNILVLQKILGHSDIKMTMRYAHFSPDHLIQAAELNPISSLGL
ncbi:tyrosine-type recombinase/integrase [Vibrio parahaemolyticus]|uniref:phage integrase n=1 Tax=Vibrio parahaemolyticus TaxID=670 RepID=UPI002361561E|nr:tyrosine-type recombinase/integrase [Vibrio parahaemolyticus]EJE8523594.1 tyrosine-type recombinase/integrase [Vibrio parahaemolyticus]ELS9502365.1 tyrosine-type recombinase/integrase [Vibrio parahaemolyticus]MBE3878298.1 tyrosine-type recombinase/integrase [Vibrio parahaemolyticus]MBE4105650.1 tyrosine-type recombinase/integrase [Vibrio parahaemolyticus]MBE5114861.1 tyrosine-type recombinase/integrase [Vibrio parahaemolyticus]